MFIDYSLVNTENQYNKNWCRSRRSLIQNNATHGHVNKKLYDEDHLFFGHQNYSNNYEYITVLAMDKST